MRLELLRHLNFISHDFLSFIGVFLAATIAPHFDLLRQHGERSIGIGFPEQDAVFVTDIALVVEAVILADNNPKVVSGVLHRDISSKFPKSLEKGLPPIVFQVALYAVKSQ
jgi:hypothetical protein